MGYSIPFNKTLALNELKKKYILKELPNAIPYVTSYYKKDWDFVSPTMITKIKKGNYKVFINSSLKKGDYLMAKF